MPTVPQFLKKKVINAIVIVPKGMVRHHIVVIAYFCAYRVSTVVSFQTIYGAKKDPVWVYLEKEMLANVEKKPYNEKVGKWLRYLKDLRYYFYCEGK